MHWQAVEIDVVSVCTPTGRHGEVAIEALEAGKHVIIEKPAETTLAKTDEIIAAQRRAGTQVAVISQHRFDPATEVAVAAIGNGELGRLTSGIASIDWWRGQTYYDSGDWRGTWELDGGGALMNQGVHTVDLLVATMGRPVEVFAYTGTLAHERIEVEDVAVGVVRFENGAIGVLHATTAAYPGLSARLQVHGDRGSVVIDNDKLTFIHLTPSGGSAEERAYGSRARRSTRSPTTPRPRGPPRRPPAATPVNWQSTPIAANTRTSWLRWLAQRPSGSIWKPIAARSESSRAYTNRPGPGNRSPCDHRCLVSAGRVTSAEARALRQAGCAAGTPRHSDVPGRASGTGRARHRGAVGRVRSPGRVRRERRPTHSRCSASPVG